MKRILLALLLTFLSASAAPAFLPEIHWIVLMGQSNMVGAAGLPAEQSTKSLIYNFSNAWELVQSPVEPIDSSAGQVDMVSYDRGARFGPSLQIAKAYVNLTGRAVGLIPCAKAATSIIQWQTSESRDTLYGSCLARVRYALENYGGNVDGLVVWQGERDTFSLQAADGWAWRFRTLVGDFRDDIGSPGIPVVYVQIAEGRPDDIRRPYWTYFRDFIQPSLLPTHPNYAMVISKDQPTKDGIHMTINGYVVVGRRIAEALIDISEHDYE